MRKPNNLLSNVNDTISIGHKRSLFNSHKTCPHPKRKISQLDILYIENINLTFCFLFFQSVISMLHIFQHDFGQFIE